MLVGRFLLHLQEAGTRTLRVNTDDPLHLAVTSTPSFVRAGMGTVADDPSYGNNPEPEVSQGQNATGPRTMTLAEP